MKTNEVIGEIEQLYKEAREKEAKERESEVIEQKRREDEYREKEIQRAKEDLSQEIELIKQAAINGNNYYDVAILKQLFTDDYYKTLFKLLKEKGLNSYEISVDRSDPDGGRFVEDYRRFYWADHEPPTRITRFGSKTAYP